MTEPPPTPATTTIRKPAERARAVKKTKTFIQTSQRLLRPPLSRQSNSTACILIRCALDHLQLTHSWLVHGIRTIFAAEKTLKRINYYASFWQPCWWIPTVFQCLERGNCQTSHKSLPYFPAWHIRRPAKGATQRRHMRQSSVTTRTVWPVCWWVTIWGAGNLMTYVGEGEKRGR